MSFPRATATAAILVLFASSPALAQTTTSGGTGTAAGHASTDSVDQAGNGSGNAGLSDADKRFLRQSARGAAYELQISRMAAQKAADPDVKQYAQMIVADHTSSNEALHQVSAKAGVTLPSAPTRSETRRANRLQALSGSAFDKAYVQEVKQANQRDIKDETKELSSTENQQVKTLVSKFRQMDEKHAQAASSLQASGASNG